MVIDIEILVIA